MPSTTDMKGSRQQKATHISVWMARLVMKSDAGTLPVEIKQTMAR